MFGWNKEIFSHWSPLLFYHPCPLDHLYSGGYGRLDSPWRVRSHLKTLGQPKAGTVTITQPLSQREHEEKNSHKVGRNRRGRWAEAGGTWIVLSDDQKHERLLSQKGRSLRPRTNIWSKWILWRVGQRSLLCSCWRGHLPVSKGCGQKGTLYQGAVITDCRKTFPGSFMRCWWQSKWKKNEEPLWKWNYHSTF